MKELLNNLQTKCKGLKAHEFVSVQVADMQQILFAAGVAEQLAEPFALHASEAMQYDLGVCLAAAEESDTALFELYKGQVEKFFEVKTAPVYSAGSREPTALICLEVEETENNPGSCGHPSEEHF